MSRLSPYLSIFISLLILFAVLLFISPMFISTRFLKGKIQESLTRITGLNVELRGPIRLSLIPSTKIILEEVAFSNPSRGIKLETACLDLKLKILPLLKKKIMIDDIIVNSFVLELNTSKLNTIKHEAQSDLRQDMAQRTSYMPSVSNGLYLGTLRLHKGTLKLKYNDHYKVINEIETDISSHHDNKELTYKASCALDGLKLKFNMTTSSLNEIISQRSSKITLKLQIVDIMDLSLSGHISYNSGIFIPNIKADAHVSQLSKILQVFGSNPKDFGLKDLHIASDIYYKEKLYHVDGDILFRDQRLKFILTFHKNTNDAINLNITSDVLNLNNILNELNKHTGRAGSDNPPETKSEKTSRKDSTSKTIHTTVAIKRLLLRDQEFMDVRLKAYIKGNVVRLEQGSLRVYGGIGDLKAMYQIFPNHSPLWLHIGLSSADISSIMTNLFQNTDITGKLDGELDLETTLGQNSSPIINNKGHGRLVLSKGVIKKGKTLIEIINFLQAIKGRETGIDSLSYRFIIAPFELQNGKIIIKDGTFDSEILAGSFTGYVDLKNEFMEIFVKPKESKLLGKKKVISFSIKGNFKEIKVIPQFQEVLEEKARKYLDLNKIKERLKELSF